MNNNEIKAKKDRKDSNAKQTISQICKEAKKKTQQAAKTLILKKNYLTGRSINYTMLVLKEVQCTDKRVGIGKRRMLENSFWDTHTIKDALPVGYAKWLHDKLHVKKNEADHDLSMFLERTGKP